MKRRILTIILVGPLLFGLPVLRSLHGQTCSDDEGMVKGYVQSLTELVGTVKKESLSDFEKDYHQQSCLTRLTLSLGIVNSLIDCLNKAAKDPAATPEQLAATKSKLENYTKLKTALEQDRDALKAAKDTKTAKSIIEKFVLTA
jgi:predicted ribosome quality control (RQC) complex YloA/Tae2 family protein